MTTYQTSVTPRAAQPVIPPGTERIEGPYHPLRAMLAKSQRKGELIVVAGPWQLDNGRGAADVHRIRAARSPWIARSVIVALIVTPLFALGYMVKMIVDSIAAIDLTGATTGALFVLALAVFTAALFRRRAERRPWVEGTFKARIK